MLNEYESFLEGYYDALNEISIQEDLETLYEIDPYFLTENYDEIEYLLQEGYSIEDILLDEGLRDALNNSKLGKKINSSSLGRSVAQAQVDAADSRARKALSTVGKNGEGTFKAQQKVNKAHAVRQKLGYDKNAVSSQLKHRTFDQHGSASELTDRAVEERRKSLKNRAGFFRTSKESKAIRDLSAAKHKERNVNLQMSEKRRTLKDAGKAFTTLQKGNNGEMRTRSTKQYLKTFNPSMKANEKRRKAEKVVNSYNEYLNSLIDIYDFD